jgi:serine/threonine-protein kinase
VVSLETGQRRTLLEGGSDARYLHTGHLVYVRGDSLYAVPLDLARLAVTGSPVPVLDAIANIAPIGLGNYAFSPAGNLVYFANDPRLLDRELVWLDRKGIARPLAEARRPLTQIALSPDGRQLAAVAGTRTSDIWIYDLSRGSWDRLTSEGVNNSVVWAPDGRTIAFASNRNGSINPFWMPVDRSRPARQLVRSDQWTFPISFSPDGRLLLLLTQTPETGLDISVLSLDPGSKPQVLIQSPASEYWGKFSPDGRYVAYVSDAPGRPEVYVTSYPGPGGLWQVSTEGGNNPAWSRDGRELFYIAPSRKLMAVPVETRPEFRAGVPAPLFDLGPGSDYDVAPNGQSFAVIRKVALEEPQQLSVVLNWFDDVRRRMTANKKP